MWRDVTELRLAPSLGWSEIPAVVLDLDSLDAEAAQIDENIARSDLKALDLSLAIARRKMIYETKHPETKRGGDRKSKQKNSVLIPSFAEVFRRYDWKG